LGQLPAEQQVQPQNQSQSAQNSPQNQSQSAQNSPQFQTQLQNQAMSANILVVPENASFPNNSTSTIPPNFLMIQAAAAAAASAFQFQMLQFFSSFGTQMPLQAQQWLQLNPFLAVQTPNFFPVISNNNDNNNGTATSSVAAASSSNSTVDITMNSTNEEIVQYFSTPNSQISQFITQNFDSLLKKLTNPQLISIYGKRTFTLPSDKRKSSLVSNLKFFSSAV